MKKAEIKDRLDLVDDRFAVMIKKYPVLSAVVIGAAFLIGLVTGWWLL